VLYPAGTADEHGWVQPGTTAIWSGRGALQIAIGVTGVDADGEGGQGPFAPSSRRLGLAFFPTDAPVADGLILEARGQRYALSLSHLVKDPVGGDLDCYVAGVTGDWS